MPQRKIFVATRILVFDFELFIGVFKVILGFLGGVFIATQTD